MAMRTCEAPPRFEGGDRICPGLYARERLGTGRLTECWLAWSMPHCSHVVVRLPRLERLGDERAPRRLAREARTLRRLAHPAIQRLLADGHRDPVPHLVLEYVDGPTLADLLDTEGPLTPGDVVRT